MKQKKSINTVQPDYDNQRYHDGKTNWAWPCNWPQVSTLPLKELETRVWFDPLASTELLQRFWSVAFTYCYRVVSNIPFLNMTHEIAEEAADDGFLSIFNKMTNGGLPCNFHTGVMHAMRWSAIRKIRQETHYTIGSEKRPSSPVKEAISFDKIVGEELFLKDIIPDDSLNPEEVLLRKEMLLDVEKAFGRLSLKMRGIWKLYYVDGCTLEQIGREIGLTRERVRQLLDRSAIMMRKEMILLGHDIDRSILYQTAFKFCKRKKKVA